MEIRCMWEEPVNGARMPQLTMLFIACRFYRKLPEVKRKTAEETRAKEYAENRMKAKLYQQVSYVAI